MKANFDWQREDSVFVQQWQSILTLTHTREGVFHLERQTATQDVCEDGFIQKLLENGHPFVLLVSLVFFPFHFSFTIHAASFCVDETSKRRVFVCLFLTLNAHRNDRVRL